VAKILVADDNSNVQKTVILALAELGVEVVAVNNGDAAVRKLADVSPDLVLADIFMPVRNGYEVCEYVKKDPRFAHVPVVLLVGAFDPLDEREAQRVGADGILKKPFVPPDPLITMVKTLLDRTLGDRLVAVGASKPAVSIQGKAGGVSTAEEHPSAPETLNELPMEEFLPPVDRLSFGEGERPIAFGKHLETPAEEFAASGTGMIEPVDDEQILTSSRDASLGDPIFWRADEPEREPESETSAAEEDISSDLPMRPWKLGEDPLSTPSSTPSSTSSSGAEADSLQPVEPFELVRDEKDEEAGETSTIVASPVSLVQDAASQALLTVDAARAEDLAANPLEWMATAPPQPPEETHVAAPGWNAVVTEATDSISATEADNLKTAPEQGEPETSSPVLAPISVSVPTPEPPPIQPQAKIAVQIPDPLKTQPSLKPLSQTAEDTAHSIPRQDWADLSAALQAKQIEPVAEKAGSLPIPIAQPPAVTSTNPHFASTNSAPTVSKPLTQSPEDTAHSMPSQDWADLSASLQAKPIEPVAEKAGSLPLPVAPPLAVTATNPQSASPAAPQAPSVAAPSALSEPANPAPLGSPDPALVEAVVQRVLDKMRPQVVDIITKEFLRPVVQALVNREIQKR
jgi:CheY-like chemotaxis protein